MASFSFRPPMADLLKNLLLTCSLLLAVGLAYAAFNAAATPERLARSLGGAVQVDHGAIVGGIDAGSVRDDLAAFAGFGSRFVGSPGHAAARAHLVAELEAAGYDVLLQPFAVTVPVTREAVLEDADTGEPIAGLTLHPIEPNHFRASSTPVGGITGTVVASDGEPVDPPAGAGESIALLPLGTDWRPVAEAGARVLLFHAPAGVVPRRLDYRERVSLDLPRFFVEGDAAAAELAGRTVRVRSRVVFEEVTAVNVVAVTPERAGETPGGARGEAHAEALLLSTYYDAHSFAPDAAPGANQSAGAVVLLQAARRLIDGHAAHARAAVLVFHDAHGESIAGARSLAGLLPPGDGGEGHGPRLAEELQEVEERLAGLSAFDARSAEDAPDAADATTLALARSAISRKMEAVFDELERERLGWVRRGSPLRDEAGAMDAGFERFQAGRTLLSALDTRRRDRPLRLLDRKPAGLDGWSLPDAMREEAATLGPELEATRDRLDAQLALLERLAPIDRFVVLNLDLTLEADRLALVAGEQSLAAASRPADSEVMTRFASAAEGLQRVDPEAGYGRVPAGGARLTNLIRARDVADLPFGGGHDKTPMYLDSSAWSHRGHAALTLVGRDDLRAKLGTPLDRFEPYLDEGPGAAAAQQRLAVLARLLTAASAEFLGGRGVAVASRFRPDAVSIAGSVVGRLDERGVADFPMAGSVVQLDANPADFDRLPENDSPLTRMPPGVSPRLLATAGRDGTFELPGLWGTGVSNEYKSPVYLDAARMNPATGEVFWTLLQPQSGVGSPFRSRGIELDEMAARSTRVLLFHARALGLYVMPDPTTLEPYDAVEALTRDELTRPSAFKIESQPGAAVVFTPPGEELILQFMRGSGPGNRVQSVAAFALHVPPGTPGDAAGDSDSKIAAEDASTPSELPGEGYLSGVISRVPRVELDAARSMAAVNDRRVTQQVLSHLADPMLERFNASAVELAADATRAEAAGEPREASRLATRSLAYASHVYPLSRRISEDAIWGIVFYLFLAVPFVVFAEKLLIGSPDLRVQLGWVVVFFVSFFLALRFLHPAYDLVRSPYVILLGFVTLTLSLVVGGFVAGKFSRGIADAYQTVRKRAETADVSRAGATAVAFSLGLNNMRKRPIRTGLTVVTLVLMTFVMLMFTTFRADVADVERPLGEAGYDGLLVRDAQLAGVDAALAPVREMFGDEHVVSPRRWLGNFTAQRDRVPELMQVEVRAVGGDRPRTASAAAVLGLSKEEARVLPVADTLVAGAGWHTRDDAPVCYLPEPMARQLRITPDAVDAGTAEVTLSGRSYRVAGIFDDRAFDQMLDLDGDPLTPIDIRYVSPTLAGGSSTGGDELATPEGTPRLPSAMTVITPVDAVPGDAAVCSIAVAMPGLTYGEARETITSHLERTGEAGYFGLGGTAYFGGRVRRASLEGFVDLLLPVLLAALTVLNTMYGSVYERRDELYVFNAVGLAPHHVKGLFFAEAAVYAVVGVVGGYLLAQGLGAALELLNLGGGLTMNFSSLSGIAVSLVIIAIVFLSTVFPARAAARLAAPADAADRRAPTPRVTAWRSSCPSPSTAATGWRSFPTSSTGSRTSARAPRATSSALRPRPASSAARAASTPRSGQRPG